MQKVSAFPKRVQKKFVGAGSTEVVYSFKVYEGYVAFIYIVGSNPTPEGAEVDWLVDGEKVDAEKERLKVGSIEKPTKVNPPIVVEKEVLWKVSSPIDYEYEVLIDGKVYELPLTRECISRAVEVALETIEVKPVEVKPEKESTFIIDRKNVEVEGSWEICDQKGLGELHELLILTTTTDFSLTVIIDGRRYEGSYSDYSDYSGYIDEIAAFQSDSNYRIHLTNMSFTESLRAYVRGTLTLSKVYCKYVVRT